MLRSLGLLLAKQPDDQTADDQGALQGQFYALRSVTNFHIHMDFESAAADADEAVRRLPASEGGALSTALVHRSFADIGIGGKDKPVAILEAIIRDPAPMGPAKAQAYIGLALLYFMTGKLGRLGPIAERMAMATSGKSAVIGTAQWVTGLKNYEINRLDEAAEEHNITYGHRHRSNYLAGFYAGCSLVRIWQLRGEYERAQSLISDLYYRDGQVGQCRFP